MAQVVDDEARQRYALTQDGETAFAAYQKQDGVITFTHTIVPEALRGHGVGTMLVKGALANVRRQGDKIIAECPFVADYVARHPEEEDLLA